MLQLQSKLFTFNMEAAASEAKKDALALKYKVSREEVDQIADVDPTPNGVYTEWLTKAYKTFISRHQSMREFLDAGFTEKLKVFEKLKNSPQWKLNHNPDINRYTVDGFFVMVDTATRQDLSKKERERDLEQNKDKYVMQGSQLLGNVGPFRVYKVTTVEASQVMSKDTHWCTQGAFHAEKYLSMGPLYVVTTPGDDNEEYNSDKFCQIFAPAGYEDRIECQDIHGDDLGEQMDDGYIVTRPEFWPLFEFIAKYDPAVDSYIKNGIICDSEESYYEGRDQCDLCDRTFKSGEGLFDSATGQTFCGLDCFREGIEGSLKDEIAQILAPQRDSIDRASQEAKEKWQYLVSSEESPIHKFILDMKNAVNKFNEGKEPSKQIQESYLSDIGFYVDNTNAWLRAGDDKREKTIPGATEGEMLEARDLLEPLKTAVNGDFNDLVGDAADDIKGDMTPDLHNEKGIKELLEKYDYLNPDGSFKSVTSSWRNPLLIKDAAASQAKKDALARKYNLEPDMVTTLADIDPTPNGAYTEWLCRMQSRGELNKIPTPESGSVEDYIISLLSRFDALKRPGTPFREKNSGDINSYDVESLMNAIETSTTEDLSKKEKERQRKLDLKRNRDKYLTDGAQFLGDIEGEYAAYRVTTPQAAAILGEGSHWCTRGSYGSSYLASAPLYVFTTPSRINKTYDSDKFLQIYVPEDVSRIEAQLYSGSDIGENLGGGYWVSHDEYWKFFEFLTHHDERIKRFVDEHIISDDESDIDHHVCENCGEQISEDDTFGFEGQALCESCYDEVATTCDSCGSTIGREDTIYFDGEDLCEDCFESAKDDFVDRVIHELFDPYKDVIKREEAKEEARYDRDAVRAKDEWENLQENPGAMGPVVAEYLKMTDKAIDTVNNKRPGAVDRSRVDLPWHIRNLESCISTVKDGSLLELYPNLPKIHDGYTETADRSMFRTTMNIFRSLQERINQGGSTDFYEGAKDLILSKFDSTWDEDKIKKALIKEGYLNSDGSFKEEEEQ